MSDNHYRLDVRHRAHPPKPYKWEIYRDDGMMPVESSRESYRSASAAREAGQARLEKLQELAGKAAQKAEKKPKRPRDPNRLAKAIVDEATEDDEG